MKKAKRLASLMLTLIMGISICTPALATERNVQEESYGIISSSERQRIYEQLERQNAVDSVSTHEYIYITTSALGVQRGSDDEFTPVNAEYGGTLGYKTSVSGIKTEVAITFLDFENSYYYVLNYSQIGVADVLLSILGYVPFVGSIASSIANAKAIVTSLAYESIQRANGYAKITVKEDYNGCSTTLSGWDTHSKICLTDALATNIAVTLFPETHPLG